MSIGPPLPHPMVPNFKFIYIMSKRHHGTIVDPLPADMTSEASLEKKSQEDPPSNFQWYHTFPYVISNINWWPPLPSLLFLKPFLGNFFHPTTLSHWYLHHILASTPAFCSSDPFNDIVLSFPRWIRYQNRSIDVPHRFQGFVAHKHFQNWTLSSF